MSNTATAQAALPIRVGGAGPVIPYVLTFDTTNTDLTIVTPGTGKMAAIVGMWMSQTAATNIILTSGTTQLVTLQLAGNEGIYDKINSGAIFITQPAAALKIQVSVAVPSMLIYVVQAAYFDFSGRN